MPNSCSENWFFNRLPWIFATGLLISLLIHTVANPDIFYHLADGENLLHRGLAARPDHVISVSTDFKDVYWLFQIVCYKIMSRLGIAGLTFFFGVLWLATFAGLLKISRLTLTRPLSMVIFVAAVIVCQIRFQERPEILSFLFLTADLILLWRPVVRPRDVAALIFVQILWCNTHGYFILGPAVAGLWSLSRILEALRKPRKLSVALPIALPIALIAASMVSPFGWRNWQVVYDQWKFLAATAEMVNETKATFSYGLSLWNLDVFWCTWIFIAALTAALGQKLFRERRSLEIFAFLLALSGLVLGATVARNVPLTILMASPLLALNKEWLAKVSVKVPAPLFTMALPLAMSVWVVSQGFYKSLVHPYRFGVGVSEFAFPLEFEKYLDNRPPPADSRWFSDGNWGSFLEFHHPEVFLYGDSRYAGESVGEFFAAAENAGVFFTLNEREKFDGAVFDVGRSLGIVMTLLKDPRWLLAYRDLSTAYFVNVEKKPAMSRWPIGDGPAGALYAGQDLSERIYGNDAIQWTEAMVGTDNLEGLMGVLDQFGRAKEIPAPVLQAGLLYLRLRPDGPLTAKLFALRPQMLALDERDALDVDNKLAAVKAGTYWNGP